MTVPCSMWDLSSPTTYWTFCPLQWIRGFLTAGLPGACLHFYSMWILLTFLKHLLCAGYSVGNTTNTEMAESFLGLTAHMRQELSVASLLLHKMGGRALGAQAALSEVRREAGRDHRAKPEWDWTWWSATGAWNPGWLQGRGGVGAFEASCGRLGWKGELEELVRGPSVQCFKKGWVVLSITDGKVLMKLSYTLQYSRQGQIMQRIHQILMFGSYLQRWAQSLYSLPVIQFGALGGARGKEPACQCKRLRRYGFDTWVGKIPWRRAWQPTPVFLPGESHGQRSLAGYGP